jgi:beta-galactosidase GanA
LAEYRSFIKWLVHNHIPFDIIVRPDAAELSRYQTVIAPSLVLVSDNNANFRDYVFGGGNLIITKTGNA